MALLPLTGYRMIDFGTAWAGSVAGHILADMGAEVIKVESREKVDPLRHGPGPEIRDKLARATPEEKLELNPWFHLVNRGKLDITLNLKDPRGIGLLKKLVAQSDAVLDNFTPGVLERMGLGYSSLRRIKPDIVLVSLSSTGQRGPMADVRAYASTLAALCGIVSVIGYRNETVPGQMRFAYCDMNASIHGALALLIALLHRNHSGQGQYIDISQSETTTGLLGEAIMDYVINGRVWGPQGNGHRTMTPHGNYPCQGEDRWVSIAVDTDEEWESLCRALGDPPWSQESRFADKFGRLTHREELDKLIAGWTSNHTPYQVMETLQKAGVAAAPVLNLDQRCADPQLKAREDWLELDHPVAGKEPLYGISWKLAGTPGKIQGNAPLLGQHNDYIFSEILGLPEAEMESLIEEKVIH
ncbi:MAG: CoA transferase [Chloroflexi bacterium]|nr:CoA transferase [Chloroflexota bacterium]